MKLLLQSFALTLTLLFVGINLNAQCGPIISITSVTCDSTTNEFFATVDIQPAENSANCDGWTSPDIGVPGDVFEFGEGFTFGPFNANTSTITVMCATDTTCFSIASVTSACNNNCGLQVSVVESVCEQNPNGNGLGASVTLVVTNTGGGNTYSLTNSNGTSFQGIYGQPVRFGPFPNTGLGVITFDIADDLNPNCLTTRTIQNPCSDSTNCPLGLLVADTTWATCGNLDGSITFEVVNASPPYVISYLGPDGATGSVTDENVITGLGSGDYLFTLVDATDFCDVSVSYTIPEINGINVELIRDLEDCVGTGSLTAVVSGGVPPYDYTWNGGQTTQTISVNALNTVYTVTITDNEGCSEIASIFVGQAIEPLTLAPDSFAVRDAVCGFPNGGISPFVFGGSPPYAFSWSNG
ncbi:MAG: SprB repeat-containing protein, partial [Bacteroidota bacterium]